MHSDATKRGYVKPSLDTAPLLLWYKNPELLGTAKVRDNFVLCYRLEDLYRAIGRVASI